jgi:RNA polymerase sigma factor for flagellar operon FliA
VPDTASEAPGERLTREDLLGLVAQRLSPQEARIVYLKYWEDLSLREIGDLEGLSESRVCKIHMKLLERLQERLRAIADV